MKYKVRSLWSGQYACTKAGFTNSIIEAIWWFLKWSIQEFFRVLRLNRRHYGNIFGIGEPITDCLGRSKKHPEFGLGCNK